MYCIIHFRCYILQTYYLGWSSLIRYFAFGYGMVLIYYSLNNYIIDTYAKYAASALATKVF